LWPLLGLLAVLPVLHHSLHAVVVEVLVYPFVVNLNHRGIDTSAKALNFLQSEQTVLGSFAHLNSSKVLDSLDNFTSASNHAGGSAANLKMVLSDLGTVEHSVETSDFVDLHGSHFEDLCNLVHGRQSQKVVVLFLGNEKSGDTS